MTDNGIIEMKQTKEESTQGEEKIFELKGEVDAGIREEVTITKVE